MSEPAAGERPLVLDATVLHHWALAERLDEFGYYLRGRQCWTTELVRAELRGHAAEHPTLRAVEDRQWLVVTEIQGQAGADRLLRWHQRVGCRPGKARRR